VLMIDSNKPLVNPPQEMHHRLLEHQKKPMPKVVQQMMEAEPCHHLWTVAF